MRFDCMQDQRKIPVDCTVNVGPKNVLLFCAKNGVFRACKIEPGFTNGSYLVPMVIDERFQLLEVITVCLA